MNNSGLITQFIETVQKAGATVEKINSSAEELSGALIKNISGAKTIIMPEPQFIPVYLLKSFNDKVNVISQPDAGHFSSADVGITDAFAGVARTGSICILAGSGLSNYTSLLPRKHIAILESKNIAARPRDIFELYVSKYSLDQKGWIFISGPSATADMGELVRGVHGPDKLHIILID